MSQIQTPLRVGLLLDTYIQPRWVHRIVSEIQASAIAQVVLVVKNEHPAMQVHPPVQVHPRMQKHPALSGEAGGKPGILRKPGILQKLYAYRHDLLYLLYRKLDERLFRPAVDAFAPADLRPLLGDCPTLGVVPIQKKYSDYLEPEDIERIRQARLDVALRFGFRILRGDFLKIARYGVWSYHHGDNQVNRGGPPGFWEVMEGNPITGSILQILSEQLDGGQVIYRSYAATDPHSVKRSKSNYYWKSSAFVMRKLKDLYERGPQALEGEGPDGRYQPYSQRLYTQPRNREMIPLLWKWASSYARAKLTHYTHFTHWFLAYQIGKAAGLSTSLYRFKRIVPPRGRFWADPFPLKRDERYYIFIEEYLQKTKKGHIAVIEMDAHGEWQAPVKVLERDYHLSYPFVFEWRGETFMIPESSDHKTIELYRCVSFPDQWQLEQVLMEGVTGVDATLAEIDGLWWMFVNLAEEGASKNDELHLFYADTPLGPWLPHRRNPVKSDVRSSRPAGRLFQWNGAWYRPAQDCSQTYGYATVLNEIVQLDRDCFEEREVSRILPQWEKGLIATHTLSRVDGLTVVDAMKLKRNWL